MQLYKRSAVSSKGPQTKKNTSQIIVTQLWVRGVKAVLEIVKENTSGNFAQAILKRPMTLDLIH